MPTLKTPLCDLLRIEYPILQAGMGGVSFGRLAAAVSNAGGLGCLGAIDMSPEVMEQEIKLFRRASTKPLGVDLGFPARAPKDLADVKVSELPGPIKQLHKEINALGVEITPTEDQAISLEDARRKLDIALAHGVEVIACALGTPRWVVEQCHAKGAKVMSIVGRARHAQAAIRNGTDAVIVQGTEGGGHTGDVGLVTLLAEVLDFSAVPVVAAGGIVNGAQIAGILTQGAQGVWIGTRFLATEESVAESNFKAAVVEADHDTTLRSPIFDGLHVRQLRNRFTDAWDGHWDELQPYPIQRVLTAPIRFAAARHDLKDYMNLAAGQGSGLIRDIPPAGALVSRLVAETVAALQQARTRITVAD